VAEKTPRERVVDAIQYANSLAGFLGAMDPKSKPEKATVNDARIALGELNVQLWRLWLWLGADGQKFLGTQKAADLDKHAPPG
jgi:hypothetical protein